jgi:thiosulfate dehydrogenase [quinone] large subunit
VISSARLREPGWVLLPLRLMLGATFLFAGLQKLADPNFLDPAHPSSIQRQLATFRGTSPIGPLLGPVAEHAVAFGVLTALAEIAVGLGTLLGLYARVAALGGFLLSTSFFLTVSWGTRPYYYGSDVFVMVMWLPLVAVGAAGVLSLDGRFRRAAAAELGVNADDPPRDRRRELTRRTVVRSGAAAAMVAGSAVALAGADAALGRRLAGDEPSSASGGAGTVLGTAADVPVGGAKEVKAHGGAAFVVQPVPGDFKAFSAICTHAGCPVTFRDGRFACPCHGSVFDAATGRVLSGPATRPLPQIAVRDEAGEIRTT